MPVYKTQDEDFKVHVVQITDGRGYGDSDEENESKEGDDVAVKLNLYESDDLLILRQCLTWTACLVPRRETTGRFKSTLARFLVFCGLFGMYLYDLGLFGNRTLVDEELKQTLTTVKNACWSLRFVLLYVMGWIYFSTNHLEHMLSSLKLTQKYWKKAQKTLWKIMVIGLVLFVFVLPLTCRAIQMRLVTKSRDAFDVRTIAFNLTLSFLSRFFGLPVFVAFVYVIYLTYTQIRLYKRQIQRWERDKKEQAREEFIDVMTLVQKAEKAFQKFLLVQVGLLLVVLIPAVLSFAERINAEGHYSETYVDPAKMKNAAAGPAPSEEQLRSFIWSNVTQPYKTLLIGIPVHTAPNVTDRQMQTHPEPHTTDKVDEAAIAKVTANALGLFFEMLVLCSLPLFLLAKVSKIMAQLPEAVQMLKFEAQKEEGYMIQSREDSVQVLEFLRCARGFRVLGMDLTTVKVALITLVMPFLTTVIHLMMAHVDITN